MRLIRISLLLLLALLMGACGGMKFNRTTGAHKYRALPVGAVVKVVATAKDLPQPTADIGTLSWVVETRSQPKADEKKASERFQTFGARYGCDAVVGTKSETRQKSSTKRVKKLGPDGKNVFETVTTAQYTHTYTARCMRTKNAPGGLLNDTKGGGGGKTPSSKLNLPTSRSRRSTAKKSTKVEKDADVISVWLALSPYRDNLLKNWRAPLRKAPATAYDVLAAFSELMVRVSGPTGIWRKTVPYEWFGCRANPKQEQCTKLKQANTEFKAWDALHRSMERQSQSSARGWIKRNKRRLLGYLERYVPSSPNLTGLQQTPLYMDKMR